MPSVPDVAFINLEYESGTAAHVELSWLAPSKLRRTAVVGSRKMVVYDDTSIEPVRIFDSGVDLPTPGTFGEYRLTYRTGEIVSPRVDVAEPIALELADFCAAIRTGSQLRSTPRLGEEVVRIVEAAERSLAEQGARVRVAKPRPVDDCSPQATLRCGPGSSTSRPALTPVKSPARVASSSTPCCRAALADLLHAAIPAAAVIVL